MHRAAVADQLNLSEEKLKQRLTNGTANRFYNWLAWAKTYLERAGLIEKIRRGCFRISPVGKEVLADPPKRIDINFLNQFPGFADFPKKAPPNESTPVNVET